MKPSKSDRAFVRNLADQVVTSKEKRLHEAVSRFVKTWMPGEPDLGPAFRSATRRLVAAARLWGKTEGLRAKL